MSKNWDDLSGHGAKTERGRMVTPALEILQAAGTLQAWEAGFLLFTVDWASEALRVVKPGAHSLTWALPRSSDLTKFGLRLAGWEIRETVYHLFGCLSEDTEILTDKGFIPYNKIVSGCPVLCYNIDDDTYQYEPVQEIVTYDYEDTAYRIKSDSTDQIVTRNHRCIVERGGRKVFRFAEALERQESVPVLENLRVLQSALFGRKPHSSQKKPLRQAENRQTAGETRKLVNVGVRCMREENRAQGKADPILRTACMQLSMQRRHSWGRLEGARPQSALGMDGRELRKLLEENERCKQPSMEGRYNLPQAQGELCTPIDQVCEMSARVHQHGAQGWLRDGTPVSGGASYRTLVATDGSCTPCERQRRGQQVRESNVVQEQYGTQAVRASRFTRPDLATVTPFHYKGKVWCVRVPSGAFVARRNGHVFVTGNSGFPKSHDISKAINRAAGAEREVVGANPNARKTSGNVVICKKDGTGTITAPATPEATQWNGWGTALKPAAEEWILARKPIAGTIAANVLEWGTGGLNIDACRVPIDDGATMARNNKPGDNGWKNSSGGQNNAALNGEPSGRWPANVILSDDEIVRTGFPVTNGSTFRNRKGVAENPKFNGVTMHKYTNGSDQLNGGYNDAGSAARFFFCAKASQADRSSGGEFDNDHPTVKSGSLMNYLCTLICPPGGTILDPFMGSGSTGVSARELGFGFVGIEQDAHNLAIARKRIDKAHRRVSGLARKVETLNHKDLPLFAMENES